MGDSCVGCTVSVQGAVSHVTELERNPFRDDHRWSMVVLANSEGRSTFSGVCARMDASKLAVGACIVLHGVIQKREHGTLYDEPDWFELEPCSIEACPK